MRRLVLTYNIPYCTTVEAARTLVNALESVGKGREFSCLPLKVYGEGAGEGDGEMDSEMDGG